MMRILIIMEWSTFIFHFNCVVCYWMCVNENVLSIIAEINFRIFSLTLFFACKIRAVWQRPLEFKFLSPQSATRYVNQWQRVESKIEIVCSICSSVNEKDWFEKCDFVWGQLISRIRFFISLNSIFFLFGLLINRGYERKKKRKETERRLKENICDWLNTCTACERVCVCLFGEK